jgi:hypothetical protein
VPVPLGHDREIPPLGLAGNLVSDIDNYQPAWHGQVEAIDNGRSTIPELLRAHLGNALGEMGTKLPT